MEEGYSAFGNFPEICMDLDSMDELLLNGCWLETTQGTNFIQQQSRPSANSCFASDDDPLLISSSSSSAPFLLNPSQILEKEADQRKFLPSSSVKMEEYSSGNTTFTDEETASMTAAASLARSGNFLLQGHELGSRWWMGPSRINSYPPHSSVKDRLAYAIGYLQQLMKERNFLIQVWLPVKQGSRKVLVTEKQPYLFNPNETGLAKYRDVSKAYRFAAEAESNEMVGLPSHVFLRKLPESTPDVRLFRRNEYLRLSHACRYDVHGLLALPVFESGSGTCVAVLEIANTTQKMTYRTELHNICRALEAVGLSSHNLIPPINKAAHTTLYQAASSEAASILESVCRFHKLPLALTWSSCVQQTRSLNRHSEDDDYSFCLSTVDSACFVTDEDSRSFLIASSEHLLLPGEGIVGRAFATNKHCFATDVTIFSKTNYPLCHHAKMFGYHAALAIPLRGKHDNGAVKLVVELFFPKDCIDTETQRQTLDSLLSTMHWLLLNSNLAMDKEQQEEEEEGAIFAITASDKNPNISPQERQKLGPEETSWIVSHVTEANRRGKSVALSCELQNEEQIEQKFKMTRSQWDAIGSSCMAEKQKRRAERGITMDVLRKHFAGSLKDAAKSIGVCPTTLKRICRRHGISRWPSRKIQKVGHSLRKLQLVMDSVQGFQGSIQLTSFYSSFPELNSPDSKHFGTSSGLKQSKSEPESANGGGAFKHPSLAPKSPPPSSGSQSSSGSSACCSTGTIKSDTIDVNAFCRSNTENTGGLMKRTRSQPQLLSMSLQEEPNAHIARLKQRERRQTSLPPLPAASTGKGSKGVDAIKVKATFGESKLRLSLQQNWRFKDLRKEIAERFALDTGSKFDIKYLDDDQEWVLLTCDADLEECIDVYRSSESRTIKISVHLSRERKQGHQRSLHGSNLTA